MIGEQKTKDDGFVNVSTKVPPHVAELLNIIAASKGTDIYGLLQLFIQTIISAAKCTTELDPHTKLLLQMLEMDKDWNRAFSFANPTAQMDVAQVILILQQYDGKGANRKPRKGYGMVMIEKPWLPGTKPKKTICIDNIMERVVEVGMAGLYKELRMVGIKAKTHSVRETLMMMCDAQLVALLDEENDREWPDLGDYHDFGKVIEWGNRQKRKPHRTPDSLAQQQIIRFDDFDRDTGEGDAFGTSTDPADAVEEAVGGKPFDQEP